MRWMILIIDIINLDCPTLIVIYIWSPGAECFSCSVQALMKWKNSLPASSFSEWVSSLSWIHFLVIFNCTRKSEFLQINKTTKVNCALLLWDFLDALHPVCFVCSPVANECDGAIKGVRYLGAMSLRSFLWLLCIASMYYCVLWIPCQVYYSRVQGRSYSNSISRNDWINPCGADHTESDNVCLLRCFTSHLHHTSRWLWCIVYWGSDDNQMNWDLTAL